jgi:diaminohydroxyphosphoribosylaminopyrimidine deaminase / 5-amino-6-(5-phosphoribosylamino)uracil reductase
MNHPQSFADADVTWMRRAYELAWQGEGWVEPNPMVGCVLVRDGQVIGEGWHQRYGDSHAEVNAIRAAHAQGIPTQGATAYVTLEPCCHFGKTPPCTDAIIEAGISRVVIGCSDPFEKVAGEGISLLRAAKMHVDVGVLEAEIAEQLSPFRKTVTQKLPWVIAKWAMTLDGKIASHTGDSRWISNEASRAKVHQLRGRVDAIIVGMGTVLADDPLLTARPAVGFSSPIALNQPTCSHFQYCPRFSLFPGNSRQATNRSVAIRELRSVAF